MWDLIVSVPDHCLSSYLVELCTHVYCVFRHGLVHWAIFTLFTIQRKYFNNYTRTFKLRVYSFRLYVHMFIPTSLHGV